MIDPPDIPTFSADGGELSPTPAVTAAQTCMRPRTGGRRCCIRRPDPGPRWRTRAWLRSGPACGCSGLRRFSRAAPGATERRRRGLRNPCPACARGARARRLACPAFAGLARTRRSGPRRPQPLGRRLHDRDQDAALRARAAGARRRRSTLGRRPPSGPSIPGLPGDLPGSRTAGDAYGGRGADRVTRSIGVRAAQPRHGHPPGVDTPTLRRGGRLGARRSVCHRGGESPPNRGASPQGPNV